MTLANFITIIRIIMVPLVVVFLLTELDNKEIYALIIFILAAVSDAIDGYIARKYNQISDLGKFLDPLADKLLIAGALLALVKLDLVETWVAAIIITRELFFTGFRFYSLYNNSSFSASKIAKKKTFLQIFSIGVIMIANIVPDVTIILIIGKILLYFATILTVYSGYEYIKKFHKKSRN